MPMRKALKRGLKKFAEELGNELLNTENGGSASREGQQHVVREKVAQVIAATADLQECEEDCLAEYEKLLKRCQRNATKFSDKDFCGADAIYMDPNTYDAEQAQYPLQAPTQWRRASQLSHKPQLFTDGASEGDIQQGVAGTCYFLAALAAIADNNEHLKSLFVAHNFEFGIAAVRFFKEGKWEYVIIDDFLPCDEAGNLIYAHCDDHNEFWVPLMEKAWAKMHGSYENVVGGWTYQGIMDLTGGAGQMYNTSDIGNADAVFALISSMLKKGAMVGCFSSAGGCEKALANTGLYTGHAYTVLRAVETSHGHKLIKCRNPWGQSEWSGDWSDQSGMLDRAMLKELGHVIADDGEFWMSAEDFVQKWTAVEIVHTFDDKWVKAEAKGTFRECDINSTFFRLQSTVETGSVGRCVIMLSQRDDRMAKKLNRAEPEAVALHIKVHRCLKSEYNAEARMFGGLYKENEFASCRREVTLDMELNPQYIYTIKVDSFDVDGDGVKDGVDEPFSVRVHSTLPIMLEDPGAPDFEPGYNIGTRVAKEQVNDEGETETVCGEVVGFRAQAPHYLVHMDDNEPEECWCMDEDQVEEYAAAYIKHRGSLRKQRST